MQFGDFKLHIIRESTFKLDGGSLYGVVPKPMWQKETPPDELNRVKLACNLLLIESPHGVVLVETGMGNRWTEKERQRYELETFIDHSKALESVGLSNFGVDAVFFSHLHFDHAGGSILEVDGQLKAAFPRAKHYTQKGEWEQGHSTNPRSRGSYRKDDFVPLMEQGLLVLLEGEAEILPGIKIYVSGGHTSHHQILIFESGGKKGAYFADIVPTKVHLAPPWVMGYDHYPLETCSAKSKWLNLAAEENWLVVFDHETDLPWGYLHKRENKFEFEAKSFELQSSRPS